MLLKEITKEDIEKKSPKELLESLTVGTKFTFEFLSLFLDRYIDGSVKKPQIRFKDSYKLTPEQSKVFGIYGETTVGRLILNSFVICEEYIEKFGYINEPMNSSVNAKFHENLSVLLVNKSIDYKKYNDIVNRIDWLGANLTNHTGLCIDYDSLTMSKSFKEHKNKVYADLKKNDASGNEILTAEDELIKMASKEKSHTGMYKMIKSGAKGSFTNNYKVLNIGRGIIKNGAGDLKLISNDLSTGNGAAEYIELSNNSILGTYGRSMKTAQGGYLTKLVSSGFSYLAIDKSIEDCGTAYFLTTKLTDNNFKEYLYRNVRQTGTRDFIELTLDNYKDFINKDIEYRSPMFCHAQNGICPMCYGHLHEKNGIETGLNVILTDLSSKIMNTSMKSFHDLTVKYYALDISEYF